jgi:pimeloyl-ACP methyl ester carboxylesterase
MQSYIDRVVEAVRAKPLPVLLLGHSMGGGPISGAAEAAPELVAKLVYLAAALPKNGESLMRMMDAVSQVEPIPAARSVQGRSELAPRQMLYGHCAPDVAARAIARLRPQSVQPLTDAICLSAERWGAIPKTYIVCADDRAVPPAVQRWLCDRLPDLKVREMQSDHSPFYSAPHDLAAMIVEETDLRA